MKGLDFVYQNDETKDRSSVTWIDRKLLAAADRIKQIPSDISNRRAERAEARELARTADERELRRFRREIDAGLRPESDLAELKRRQERRAAERKTTGIDRSTVRTVGLWVSEVVITLGVIMLLFVFWEVKVSNWQAEGRQDEATAQLEQNWSTGQTDLSNGLSGVSPGDPFARIYSPSQGDGFTRTVIQGTDQDALATGPGHYVGSQAPGERGNFALAGHRDGQGAPFHDIDKFTTCDAIVVETSNAWYTYRVLPSDVTGSGADSASQNYVKQISDCVPYRDAAQFSTKEYAGLNGVSITTPGDVDVVAPVPGHKDVSKENAGLSMLTLTTCHPIWQNKQRLIVHAVLVNTDMKAAHDEDWRPAASGDNDTGRQILNPMTTDLN